MSVRNFIPAVWSARILQPLRNALVYAQPGVVNRDYEGEIANMGDRVKINSVGDVTVKTYKANTDIDDPEQLTSAQQELVIDQGDYFNFAVDDVDRVQTMPDLLTPSMENAAYKVAEATDLWLAALMAAGVPSANTIGTVAAPKTDLGTEYYAVNYLIDLMVRLNKTNTPRAGRFVIVPAFYEGLLVKDPRFTHATALGDQALRNGQIGRVAGFDVMMSNNTPNTSGTKYKVIAGHGMAASYANQILQMEAFRPEKRFADAVKGLHVYGGKVVRPSQLAMLICNEPS
jgi:hypothetical protein